MTPFRPLAMLATLFALALPAMATPPALVTMENAVSSSEARLATSVQAIQKDDYRRIISAPGHQPVVCPTREQADTVLFVFGQSNSANHGAEMYQTKYPGSVYSYFNGSCYVAASPLIGASGTGGEWLTMMADRLIENGVARTVVIIPAGIGATGVWQWMPGNKYGEKLRQDLALASQSFNITEVIWHQGETDFKNGTTTPEYMTRFMRVKDLVQQYTTAPIFVSVATNCIQPNWHYPNQVTQAQQMLAGLPGLEAGVNTDELVPENERHDGCHFNSAGQRRTAEAYMNKIWQYRYAAQQAALAQ